MPFILKVVNFEECHTEMGLKISHETYLSFYFTKNAIQSCCTNYFQQKMYF